MVTCRYIDDVGLSVYRRVVQRLAQEGKLAIVFSDHSLAYGARESRVVPEVLVLLLLLLLFVDLALRYKRVFRVNPFLLHSLLLLCTLLRVLLSLFFPLPSSPQAFRVWLLWCVFLQTQTKA